jgi:hypothetical protein
VVLRRFDGVRVVGVISLAGDVGAPVLERVLIGDVVDLRTLGHGKTRIVLPKDITEDLHGFQKLGGAPMLVADGEDRVIDGCDSQMM